MSKFLKVSLKRNNLEAQLGEDIEIAADVTDLKDAVIGVAGAVGVENCLKLAGGAAAATALYVFAKSVSKRWDWVKVTDLEQDVVELSVPPKKEKKFDKLMEKGMLQQHVAEDFENLDTNLEDILGEEEYEKYGAEVETLLNDVRIGSITESTPEGQSKSILAAKVILGKENTKEYGVKTTVLCSGQNKNGGIVAGVYVGEKANVKGEKHGGNVLVTRGYDGENAANIAKSVQADDVRVKIMGDTMKCSFERGFGPRTTVREVVNQLKSQLGISPDHKVTIKRGKESLMPEWTLAHLESNGSTVNWLMEVEE